MPRGSKALLPAEIRTRPRTRVREGRYSHGLFGLSRAFDTHRGNGFPFPSLLHFRRPFSGDGTPGAPGTWQIRDQAVPRGSANSLEVRHQDPDLGFSRQVQCPARLPDRK
jgi:hypothetical protein